MGLRITLPGQCLLYLLDRGDLREGDPAAHETTQDRIAQTLNASRPHVSRAMGRMRTKGLVTTAKVHVPGERRRRLAYFLTEAGLRRAQVLRRRVEDLRIRIVDLQGNESVRRLYEVPFLLPRPPRLSDLVPSVKDDRLDLREFRERQALLKGGKVYDVKDASVPAHFRGRGAELDRLESFLRESRARGLVLVGLPGIGKTALASQWVASLKGKTHVLWRRLQQETTSTDLLRDIAELLATAGRPALSDYLQRQPEGGRSLALSILWRDLAFASCLLVFDDAHRANPEAISLLSEILHAETPPGATKVLLISRERVPYVRADDFARSRVWELEIEDLARPDALAVLQALGAPPATREDILARCGGHPFSLELAAGGSLPLEGVRRTSAAWFAEQALARVDAKGRRALALAAVFEGAAPLSALGPEAPELLRRCLLREVEGGRAVVHDLIREAVLQTLPTGRLAALHMRVGSLLAGIEDPGDIVSAIRHFLRGEGFERAAALALERGPDVIEAGLAGSLLPLLEPGVWVAGKRFLPARIRLLRGQALFALGRRAEAARAFEESRRDRDPMTAAEARLGQGKAESQRGSRVALPILLDARDRLERIGALRLLAEAQYWIGGTLMDAGRIEQAQEAFERGRAVALDIGDRRWEGLCTYGLGRLLSKQRDFLGAIGREREALDLLERGAHRLDVAKVCAGLGGNLLELNRFPEALVYLNRATSEARTTGAMGVLAATLYNLGAILYTKRNVEEMIRVHEEGLGTAEMVEQHDLAASSAAWLAWGHWSQGQDDVARRYIRRAEDLVGRTTEPALRIGALRQLGLASLRAEHRTEARGYLERALAEAREAKLSRLEASVGEALRDLG